MAFDDAFLLVLFSPRVAHRSVELIPGRDCRQACSQDPAPGLLPGRKTSFMPAS